MVGIAKKTGMSQASARRVLLPSPRWVAPPPTRFSSPNATAIWAS
jgi:hypothetical protein